jgi:mRNA interferase MazF
MNEGDVVITPLPQADGQLKNRPAIVLRKMPPFGDLLVCGVSSQTHLAVKDFDEVIEPQQPDFPTSGPKTASVIRLGFLATLPTRSFVGRIGAISAERHGRLLTRLSDHLKPNATKTVTAP